MPSKPGRTIRTCSCLLCRQEIIITNFSRHHGNKACLSSARSSSLVPHLKCRFCEVPVVSSIKVHEKWCAHNPEHATEKKNLSDRLNASWKTDHDSRANKAKETNLQRYGDENYCNTEKSKQTKLIRYGDENYRNPEKAKQTNLDRYGYEYGTQSPIIIQKTKQTNIDRYGVEYAFLLPENRPKDTNRQKAEETMLLRHGVRYSAQSEDIHTKMQSHRRTNKIFTFPSGVQYNVQGFEPKALFILLSQGYTEEDIQLINRKAIIYEYDGANHYYHPDIVLPKENRIIEVKSRYWYEKELPKNLAKQSGSILAGYSFEFMIF